MSDHEDRGLRDAFRTLREDEAHRVPDLGRLLAHGRSARPPLRDDRLTRPKRPARQTGRVAALVLAAAAVMFVTLRSIERRSVPRDLGGELLTARGIWRAPTDFLLEDRSPPLWESTTNLRETLNPMRTPQ